MSNVKSFYAVAQVINPRPGHIKGDIVDRIAFSNNEPEYYNWDDRYNMAIKLAEQYIGWCSITLLEFND